MPRTILHLAILGCLAFVSSGFAGPELFPGERHKWRQLQSEHFEMFSDTSERDSRELLRNLELLRGTFLETYRLKERQPLPVTVFVFSDPDQFEHYIPSNYQGKGRAGYAGFYCSRADRATIYMRGHDANLDARRVIFHEYTHHLMRTTEQRPPAWYNEGVAELFSSFEEDCDQVVFGKAVPGRVAQLQHTKLMPLEQLFGVTHSSAVFREGDHRGLFYAQSWALVHFCYRARTQIPREKLALFLDVARSPTLANHPEKTRELCQQILGIDYPQINKLLEQYINGGSYSYIRLASPPIADPATYQVRILSAEECRLRLAELEARVDWTARARLLLSEASAQDPKNARHLETLGTLRLHDNDQTGAREKWQQAIAAGSSNPAVFHQLAQMEMRRCLPGFDLDYRMPEEKAAELRLLLHQSIHAAPDQSAAYVWLARVEANAAQPNLANLNLVQRHYPELTEPNAALLALAFARHRLKDNSTALEMLDVLAKQEPSAVEKRNAELLRAKIEGRKPNLPKPPPRQRAAPTPLPAVKAPELPPPGK